MSKWLFRLIDRFFKFLLGDDIFISYSRADGATYAAGLANELAERGFSCRLDQWGTESGSEMPKSLKKALRRSVALVLVGTEGAAQSRHVAEEVRELKRMRRMIVPIIFDGVLLRNSFTPKDGVLVRGEPLGEGKAHEKEEALWANEVEGLPMSCEKNETLRSGEPSTVVSNRIEKTCTFWKKDKRLRITSSGVAVLLVLLLGASAWAGNVSVKKGAEARQKTAEADAAEKRAKEQERIAEKKTREADAATLRATEADATAREAERVAGEKTKLAEVATKRADDQTKIARKAEDRAKVATARADKEELKARSTLSRNYYNQAQAEAAADQESALLWAQRAAETAPPDDERRGVYKLRALHLTRRAARMVVNTPGPIKHAAFSPAHERAVTLSTHEELSVWDLRTGERLPDPLSACGCAPSFSPGSRPPFTFSPDGKWIALITRENSNNHLRVWGAASGKEQLNLYNDRRLENVGEISFTPDSAAVIFTNGSISENELLVWDLLSGRELNPIRSITRLNINGRFAFEGHSELPISRNPQHNRLITFASAEAEGTTEEGQASEDGRRREPLKIKIEVKDIRSGEVLLTIPARTNFDFVDFTGDAERVVTVMRDGASGGKVLRIWDVESGTPSAPMPFGDFSVVGMNRDGSRLLVSTDNTSVIYIWDGNVGAAKLLIALGQPTNVLRAYFSGDEKYVITSGFVSGVAEVSIWEVASGWRIQLPVTLNSYVSNFSLSPSDMTLAHAAEDGVISVQSLRQAEGRNALKVEALPLAAGHRFIRAFFAPGNRSVLTLDMENAKRMEGLMRLQLWDVATARPLWDLAGLTMPLVRDIDFHPAGNLFLTVAWEEDKDEESPPGTVVVRVRDMSTGKTIESFRPLWGLFDKAAFSRDGARLTTFERGVGNLWKIRQWDTKTGIEIPGGSAELYTEKDGRFYAFTRHGEFMLLFNHKDTEQSEWKELTVRSTEASKRQAVSFRFVRHGDAALAAALLKQALKLTVLSDGEVIAESDSGIPVSLKTSSSGATITNRRTGAQLIAPPGIAAGFQVLMVSPDSDLVLTGPNLRFEMTRNWTGSTRRDGTMSLWDAGTGTPISESMWHEGVVRSFAFMPGGEHVLTVTENGRLRLWYVGLPDANVPSWMSGMGEALSGIRVVSDVEVQRLTSEDHARVRRSYGQLLREAAERGDLGAQFVLRNWQP